MATNKDVAASIQRLIKKCGETLVRKGDEYSGSEMDRLGNFKTACQIARLRERNYTQMEILWGYLLKHITSIHYMITIRRGEKPTREQWDEKLGDAINYLLLLSAIVDEDIAKEKRQGIPDRTGSKALSVVRVSCSEDENAVIGSLVGI
jgi:hypothetical protein